MHMTGIAMLIRHMTGRLTAAGLIVYPEFGRNALPQPEDACFVTVGAESMSLQRCIAERTVPVSISLRIRIHTKPMLNAEISENAVQTVLDTLLPVCNPESAAVSAPVYQKPLDRFVAELHLQIDGLLTADEQGGDGFADAT